jgi:hypothetical protein
LEIKEFDVLPTILRNNPRIPRGQLLTVRRQGLIRQSFRFESRLESRPCVEMDVARHFRPKRQDRKFYLEILFRDLTKAGLRALKSSLA